MLFVIPPRSHVFSKAYRFGAAEKIIKFFFNGPFVGDELAGRRQTIVHG
jgi:hypothetical protein